MKFIQSVTLEQVIEALSQENNYLKNAVYNLAKDKDGKSAVLLEHDRLYLENALRFLRLYEATNVTTDLESSKFSIQS